MLELPGKDNRDLTPAQQMHAHEEEDHEGLAEMIEAHVREEDTEFFVMQSFPIFTLIQSLVIFLSYVVLSSTSGKGLAGLETFFPGRTDLALTNAALTLQTEAPCQDYRWQLWRPITYQYSHASFSHMIGNVLLLVLCGINLEGFHGSLRMMWMFEVGVLGGAGAVCVFDSHTRVVGMSGGAYALLGMQLGDVLLNWERKSAPYRLAFIFLLVLVEVMLFLFNTQDEISYSAHLGGGVAGLLLVIVFGRNLTVKTYDLEVQVIRLAKVLLFGLAAFCICWSLIHWPPMSLLDQVPWCWAREVSNEMLFGDGEFHCVRCDGPACIARPGAWPYGIKVCELHWVFVMWLIAVYSRVF
ncbi:Rhbdl2 [Symbiodinium natans]|uniref:Rhbdl2 protein n=1 Tax=Symbiodinium natans TaxID=878477 RepID=A0A812IGQ8_9DINO|nr:Rhbdl2 [Symbiodinium natans]